MRRLEEAWLLQLPATSVLLLRSLLFMLSVTVSLQLKFGLNEGRLKGIFLSLFMISMIGSLPILRARLMI